MVGASPRLVGRYLLGESFAAGGMATVHLGLLSGPTGFKRVVAIKRMHASLAREAEARATFLDEARLTSRIQHPNVVPTLDVVDDGPELFLVLEYVHGESLDRLLAASHALGRRPPPRIVTAIGVGMLRGLHAAHEALGEDRRPLELVHRDLSPHNVMVDVHGVPRVLDFGIARARGRLQATREGQLKGKLQYLAPEQVHGDASRRSDVFTAGVVLFEALTGRRLFDAPTEAAQLSQVLLCKVPTLGSLGVDGPRLQEVLDRALQREPADRYMTAGEMADALEACGAASQAELAAWVKELAGPALADRERRTAALEGASFSPATPEPSAAPRSPPQPPRPGALRRAAPVVAVVLGALAVWQLPRVLDVKPAPVVDAGSSPRPQPDGGAPDAATDEAPDAATSAPDASLAAPDAGVVTVAPARTSPDAGQRATPTRSNCQPPYVIDAQGVKRYKVECLK